MNTGSESSQAVASAKLPLITTTTPPESPPLSVPENPTRPLPISPPTTVITDPSPQRLPHRVRRLLGYIRLRYQGRASNNTWKRVYVPLDEFQALQDALKKYPRLGGWVADKLRYDYDSVDGELVFRMPSPLHDIFAGRLQEVIARELKASKEQEQVHTVVDCIKTAVTSDLRFSNISAMDKKSPDGSFRFVGTKYPPLVIEVANSQKRKDLPYIAESYVERTKGRTKTVITVDLEYRAPGARATCSLPPRKAVYSIYRNKLTCNEQTGEWQREAHIDVEDQPFRMYDSTTPAGSMRLLLSDFCPDGIISGTNDRTIAITHTELAGLLAEAEEVEAIAEAPSRPSSSERNVPFVSKRKRSPTPKLTSEDEAAFVQEEDTLAAQYLEEDYSFSSADAADIAVGRTKRIKTRSQLDIEPSP